MNNMNGKPKLLLVDDKRENLFVLEKLLKPLDVELFKATSGGEALTLALQQEFVLMLLDVQMPEMDGYEVLELMHLENRLKQLPVIFITAYYTDEPHRLKGYELGAVDYLYKPLDERVLLSKVNVFLELYKQKIERQELQHRYQLILDSAGEGIFGLDKNGFVNFVNPAAGLLLGQDPNALIGKSLEVILPATELPDGVYDWKNTLIYKTSSSGYFHRVIDGNFLKSDGGLLPVDYVITSMRGTNNEYLGVVIMFSDASQRKQTEQAQQQLYQAQKMEAIGQLTGGIAHDFNNLLMAIQGNLELLKEKISDIPHAEKYISTALNATDRGAQLTNRLLAFARKQVLFPKSVDVAQQLQSTIALLKPTLGESIEIITHLPDDLDAVWVDANQLENAIVNLAINARDAMPRGGKIYVEAKNVNISEPTVLGKYQIEPGDYVMISVTDEGEGMSAEVQQHLFEPFFTTKPSGKGTGLGLSMIYGFIKQSKGHVTVYSEAGKGTTFHLYLPKALEAETPQIQPVETVPERAMTGHEMILVVEDNVQVRELSVEYLRQLGYEVLEAESGTEALEVFKQGKPIQLLFTDVVMSAEMSGPELAVKAKELYPDIKVLFTSGYPKDSLTDRGHLATEEHHLSKPYKLSLMAQKIREILDTP